MLAYALLIGGLPVILASGLYFYLKNSAHTIRHFSMAMTVGLLLPVLFHLITDLLGMGAHEGHEHGDSEYGELIENVAVWVIMAGVFWALHSLHGVKEKLGLGLGMTLAVAAAFHHIPEGILFVEIQEKYADDAVHLIAGLTAHHLAEAIAIIALLIHENKSVKTIVPIFVIMVLPLYAGMSLAGTHVEEYNMIFSAIGVGALAHVIFDTLMYLQTQGKKCCSPRLIYSGYGVGILISVVINTAFSLH